MCACPCRHVLPWITQPRPAWDVLIGHYLGVDHAGHTFDVSSPHMAAKLLQMNEHVTQASTCVIPCVLEDQA